MRQILTSACALIGDPVQRTSPREGRLRSPRAKCVARRVDGSACVRTGALGDLTELLTGGGTPCGDGRVAFGGTPPAAYQELG